MTCLKMELRHCTRVLFALDIYRAGNVIIITFLADNVLIFTLLMCYY